MSKILTGIILVLIILLFLPTFHWLGTRFLEAESSYSHGFLVPFVSIYFVWQKRKRFKELPIKPSNWGLFFLFLGIFSHILLGYLWEIHFFSGFSLILIILGIVLYALGREYLRELAFPISFLLFAVPLPSVLLIHLSFYLKILATKISTFFVARMGVPLTVSGAQINLPNGALEIGAPCSGLRSLIALIALSFIFTQLIPAGKLKKIFLLFLSIPIAVMANVFRIMLLILISYFYSHDVALGFFHNFSGILLFGIATLSLLGIIKVLT